jgi:SPP1 gp7 family putative phage head morphogenesis protein
VITQSRLAEVRKRLFGRKLAKRPKPPNEAERLYLGAARVYADTFKQIVGDVIAETYPELLGARSDARVGPLMLGKHASKVLAHITNPLRAAQDRIPLDQVAGTVRGHVERDVQRYMPGLKNTDLFLGGQIAGWRRDNVGLITSMTDDMLEKIGNLLEDYDGTRVEDVATSLEDTFGLTRARAELIARDQVLSLNAQMNQQAQQNAGVEEFIWSTSQDDSVRGQKELDKGQEPKGQDHASLNGLKFRWDNPPVVDHATGDTALPGEPIQCRCVAIPVLEEFDEPTQMEEGED